MKLPLGSAESSPLLDWLLDSNNRDRQIEHLRRYYTTYSGRHFEWFIQKGKSPQFTPWDIIAIEALSVSLSPNTAQWLLDSDDVRDNLLDRIHEDHLEESTLWSCDIKQLQLGGPLSELYDLLREQPGLGYVTTSKLLAAKFPGVVPIRDSRVENLIDMEESAKWWEPIRQLFEMSQAKLQQHLAHLPLPDIAIGVTALRRLDVILWMESRARDRLI